MKINYKSQFRFNFILLVLLLTVIAFSAYADDEGCNNDGPFTIETPNFNQILEPMINMNIPSERIWYNAFVVKSSRTSYSNPDPSAVIINHIKIISNAALISNSQNPPLIVYFVYSNELNSFIPDTHNPNRIMTFNNNSDFNVFRQTAMMAIWHNNNNDKRDLHVIIGVRTDYRSNCTGIRIILNTQTWTNPILCNSNETYFYFSKYQRHWSGYNSSDLFLKDNSFDLGEEPYWNTTIADYTKSTSIRNTLQANIAYKTHDGINPNLSFSNFAQRSTLGNLNKMNIWVENRGCANTTSEAYLSAFWTVARVFEPWGEHWHNYSRYPQFASNNKISYTDPATGVTDNKEMGNHITLSDPWNYKSNAIELTIPSNIHPTRYDFNSQQHTGGFLASIDWNPPHSDWYFSASNIFRTANAEPVFCYLAYIREPNKPNNGFHTWYNNDTKTNITDFVLYNNNAATVNSYLATPNNRYKRKTSNNRYISNIGTIMIDNPYQYEVINLSLIGENNEHNILENGNVYLIFDEVLWSRWALSDFSGSGYEISGPNRIRITNIDSASMNRITLLNGQRGIVGIEFEYFADMAPDTDYYCSFSLGAFLNNPTNQVGSPTHFITQVLTIPDFEIDESAANFTSVNTHSETVQNMHVYPNPASRMINLSFDLTAQTEKTNLNIISTDGRIVHTISNLKTNIGSNTLTIDMERFDNGIYFVEIQTTEFVKRIKFVKQE